MDNGYLARLADLVVGFGANVQPDQIVAVSCEPGKEQLVRAIAESAYRRGARFVDVQWFDPWVKRARIAHAREETLEFVPDWYGERVIALGEARAARIALSGPVAPGVLDDLDPVRAGKDRLPALKESGQIVNERTTNWSIIPCPTPTWAKLVFPDLPEDEALVRLVDDISHVLRLDEPDPIAAWHARADTLVSVTERLTERRFDALHYEGPGTDLTVGLLPGASWQAARFRTIDGIDHMPNLPTEEVFTTPDPERADGHVAASKPLVLVDGTVVRGLRARFEGGRAVEISADTAQDTMRTIAEHDSGAARLGEVALVDAEGRIGKLDTVFYDTLIDENAASHLALGQGFPFLIDEVDRPRANESQIHIDFMIGRPDMTVTGITADGDRVPVLVQGRWQV
ncbi:MAG TPA: aminopeptidase [Solirubrobacteraceae bacterium]|nr:aminopeptidase [Solirubrobacteraceae bacterium]